MRADPYDPRSLRAFHELHASAADRDSPTLAVHGTPAQGRSVAVLPGSFNPLTAAHLMLAERALGAGFDSLVFTYARETVGKRAGGLVPEDRLLALGCATEDQRMLIAVCSHGLYADQAAAVSAAFPGADIAFLVGSDKVMQIFDGRWYADRADALDRFFDRARLIVAPRADQSDGLRRVLEDRTHRRWAERIEVRALHPAVSEVSSTRVRGLLRSGADATGLVPPSVATLLASVRAFMPPIVVDGEEVDVYRVRARVLDALWRTSVDASADDLRMLVQNAIEPGVRGRQLRALLASDRPQDGLDALRTIA